MIVLLPGLFREPAAARAGRRGDHRVAVPGRHPGHGAAVAAAKAEFVLSIAAFLGVALLGVLPGIAIAVALSILNVFRRAWWPYQTELGRVEGLRGLPRRALLPGGAAPARPGHLPVRRPAVLRQRQDLPRRDHAAGQRRAAAHVDHDRRRADHRRGHHRGRHAGGSGRGAERRRASAWCSPSSRTRYGDKIERYGLTRTIDPDHFFPTLESAIAAYRQLTGAEWTAARPGH